VGHGEPGLLRNPLRALAHDVGVELGAGTVHTVGGYAKDELFQLGLLSRGDAVGVQLGELSHSVVVDHGVDDGCLLRGAHHAVVKRLGYHDVVDGTLEVCRDVDVRGNVSGAHTQRGL